MKICEQCGELFQPGKRHPNQRFCPGLECRSKWEATHQYNAKVCTCQNCGKEYTPKKSDRNKYCGRECSKTVSIKPRGITPVFVSVCVTCGKHCKTTYCSDECHRVDEAARARKIDAAKFDSRIQSRPCKECKTIFTPEYGSKLRVFCSDGCRSKFGKRVGKAARSARKRGAGQIDSIDPIKVFERDGWKCHLCKKHTPKHLRGTIKDMAPELDHIIPLAQGGSHTWDNVACACRKCNGLKGSQIIGQQMLPVFASIGM